MVESKSAAKVLKEASINAEAAGTWLRQVAIDLITHSESIGQDSEISPRLCGQWLIILATRAMSQASSEKEEALGVVMGFLNGVQDSLCTQQGPLEPDSLERLH